MSRKPVLFVIIDGVGDGKERPSSLELALTPNLDFLAERSQIINVEIAKHAPQSSEGVLKLFGVTKHFGRGALEAVGHGVKLKQNQVAFRFNFATVAGGKIIDRRAGRLNNRAAQKLVNELNHIQLSSGKVKVYHGLEHRGVVVFTGKLNKRVQNTDPGYLIDARGSVAIERPDNRVIVCLPLVKEAAFTANLINEFIEKARRVLENSKVNTELVRAGKLPANYLLLRDAEAKVSLRKNYKNWAVVADMPLELGIGSLLGMQLYKVKIEGEKNGKQRAAKQAAKLLGQGKNVYVHLKDPDVFGHDGNKQGKMQSVEDIDSTFFETILKNVNLTKTKIVVVADHSTPPKRKAHTKEPVPALIFNNLPKRTGRRYCEKAARGLVRAEKLMNIVIRDTPLSSSNKVF